MSTITQTDKRSGITYAYETIYCWDKKNSSPAQNEPALGKSISTKREEILFQPASAPKKKEASAPTVIKPGSTVYTESRHLYYGVAYLLQTFANTLGSDDERIKFI